jgi:hypothetical protein
VESSCERGNEPSGSIKMLKNYRVAAQLVAYRVVLSSMQLVDNNDNGNKSIKLNSYLFTYKLNCLEANYKVAREKL